MPAEFHFLRPEWFYALPVAAVIYLLIRGLPQGRNTWEAAIDPALLPHLLDQAPVTFVRRPLFLLPFCWAIAVVALAGPAWEKIPQPVQEREDALVIVLDLSLSMYATDVKPNRITAAQRKLRDLLGQRNEGVTALVVFAGDAHTVTPLTDDANTIAAMLPALDPGIMPVPGSNLTAALEMANELFASASITSGRILIVTDEIRDATTAAKALLADFTPVVLGVGTSTGSPVPIGDGYLKDNRGVMVIPTVDLSQLRSFAARASGRAAMMSLDDADLDYLLAPTPVADDTFRSVDRDFDIWVEEGPWLVLLLLPLAALAFRRGWLWMLVFFVPAGMLAPPSAQALTWEDLWRTSDQQATAALDAGDAASAAEQFSDPGWRAAAQYKAGDYESAASTFAEQLADPAATNAAGTGGTTSYNLGNALARTGKLPEAISAYEAALAADPGNEDAAFNKTLVEQLLQQQQQQQEQQSGQESQQDQSEQQQSQQQQSSDGDSDTQQDQAGNPADEGDNQESSESETEQQQAENEQSSEDPDSESEQQHAEAGDESQTQENQTEESLAKADSDEKDAEERQALQQWLRRVPDDPGGLLREKFRYQTQQRAAQGRVQPGGTVAW